MPSGARPHSYDAYIVTTLAEPDNDPSGSIHTSYEINCGSDTEADREVDQATRE
jgi:hypothetical protein